MDETRWLEGVQLWYNHQDYLAAMEVWQSVVDDFDWNDESMMGEGDKFQVLEDSVPEATNGARLLLFLAGCHLDASNVRLARRLLIRCLRCVTDFSDTTARLAIQEWLCSYEEEAHVQNDGEAALAMSHRIVDYAIRKGCTYWKDPFQRPGFISPLVRGGKPHYEGNERPSWCNALEDNWEKIKDEFLNLTRGNGSSPLTTQHWPAVGSSDHRGGAGQHDHKVVDGDWREVVLFGAGAQPNLAPYTAGLIEKHAKEAVSLAEQGGGEVIFSVLSPNTRIRAHCGSTNLRLTAHLGLFIPSTCKEDCAIRVGEQWHTWDQGRVLVFDDSYEHEVKNLTTEYRGVLLLRFWHPDLAPNDRSKALSQAVGAKEQDTLRRYNPPLPTALYMDVEERGLEQSKCASCWRTGYDTIRVVDIHDPTFACSCGHRIR